VKNPTRTVERLRHHFEVERELAARLRGSNREERPALFKKLYNELFERVPDHPRLTRRDSVDESRRKVEGQMRILKTVLQPGAALIEFAPGDCRLAYEAAKNVGSVIGVDISDQRSPEDLAPPNFQLVVYDGYDLGLPDEAADVVFSYQFLEHLHPDDVAPHMTLVHRLLRPGGWYVFDTPHRMSGPHDISAAFGTDLVCFHFQEWSYSEMTDALHHAGFHEVRIIRRGNVCGPVLDAALRGFERFVSWFPTKLGRWLARRTLASVTMAARRARGGQGE